MISQFYVRKFCTRTKTILKEADFLKLKPTAVVPKSRTFVDELEDHRKTKPFQDIFKDEHADFETDGSRETRRSKDKIVLFDHNVNITTAQRQLVLHHRMAAERIARMMYLDPERDKELLELKDRLHFIMRKNRTNAVPASSVLVNIGYKDVVKTFRKYGGRVRVCSILGLKVQDKFGRIRPSGAMVSPFLSKQDQAKLWRLQKIHCIGLDIRSYLKKVNKEWMPTYEQLVKEHLHGLNREIQKYGGYQKVAELAGIPYNSNPSFRSLMKTHNFKKALWEYFDQVGCEPHVPHYNELHATGNHTLLRALRLYHKETRAIEASVEDVFGLAPRAPESDPQFVKDSYLYASAPALLQEIYLLMCMRKHNHLGHITQADIVGVYKRYDIALAINRYHGKMENIFHLLPEAPKPRDWWKSKQNVARRIRTSMNIWKTEFLPQPERWTRSGEGFVRNLIFEHGGYNHFSEYIHADLHIGPHFFDQEPGFWDKLENIEFNLKDFIIQCGLDRFPTKVEFEACGRQSLWGAMRKYALQHKKYSQSSDTDEKLLKFWAKRIPHEKSKVAQYEYCSNEQEDMSYFVEQAQRWRDLNSLCAELLAFRSWFLETLFVVDERAISEFKMPLLEDFVYCQRPDLNYAILKFHGGHDAVEKYLWNITDLDLVKHPRFGFGAIEPNQGIPYDPHEDAPRVMGPDPRLKVLRPPPHSQERFIPKIG